MLKNNINVPGITVQTAQNITLCGKPVTVPTIKLTTKEDVCSKKFKLDDILNFTQPDNDLGNLQYSI